MHLRVSGAANCHNQVHENWNPLDWGVVVLLDVRQESGDWTSLSYSMVTCVVVPVEKNEWLLLQKDDVGVDELVEFKQVIQIIKHVQIGIVMNLFL